MELTVKILREWFTRFNAEYFGGKLPEPRLLVSSARTQLGQFSCRRVRKGWLRGYTTTGYTIKVSDYYDMEERDYQQTLLHEMLHFYIAYTGRRDTSAHGQLFRQLAAQLNEAGGWHITATSRTEQYAVRRQQADAQYLLSLIQTTDGHHYLSVVNPSYRRYIERQAARSPQVQSLHFVVSTAPQYATWPKTRSLRGRRISAEEYRKMIILAR